MKKICCIGIIFLLTAGLFACGANTLENVTESPITLPAAQTSQMTESIMSGNSEMTGQSSTSPSSSTSVSGDGSKSSAVSTSKSSESSKSSASSADSIAQTPAVVSVSIPEGFSFYQIAQRLEANGVCSAAAFYTAAQSYQVQSFTTPYSSESCYHLEGFLFPDTYEFYQGEDPNAVLRKFLNNYAAKSGMPDYDTLILASIIERETRSAAHMAMVSSVFHNRLSQGMRLQADATIAYVEQHIKPSPWVQNTSQYAARYNTYKCAALPVGPICNPGLRAINAAKNPSQSDYLYYFFGNDNDNHYSITHDEHVAAKARYGVNNGSAA